MKGQSKRASLLESAVNILIGYGVAIAAQKAIFPLFGIHISTADNVKVAALFTVVSLIRSYVLRRCFNWWHVSQAEPEKPALKGTAIIENAVAKTLRSGKQGFVIAVLSERGSRDAEMVVAINGEMKQGLYHVLRKLLSDPQTKQEATGAILMALAGSGAGRVVSRVNANQDCDCPICALRRKTDERSEPTGKPH
jgi:hypothetical protein